MFFIALGRHGDFSAVDGTLSISSMGNTAPSSIGNIAPLPKDIGKNSRSCGDLFQAPDNCPRAILSALIAGYYPIISISYWNGSRTVMVLCKQMIINRLTN
jgi:hypothetical protein